MAGEITCPRDIPAQDEDKKRAQGERGRRLARERVREAERREHLGDAREIHRGVGCMRVVREAERRDDHQERPAEQFRSQAVKQLSS